MNKRTISRGIISISILLLFCTIGAFYYTRIELQEKHYKTDLFSLIPKDCQTIVQINDLHNLFNDLEFSAYAKDCQSMEISTLIQWLYNNLDTLSNHKAHGLSGTMNHLLISFHTPDNPLNQVIYGHCGSEDHDFIDTLLKQTCQGTTYKKEITYSGESIYIYPINNNVFLSCYFQKDFYIISLQKKLIEKVIDTYKGNAHSIRNDSIFNLLPAKEKNIKGFHLYTRCMPLSEWSQFDIHFHNDVIYMAGLCPNTSKNDSALSISLEKKLSVPTSTMIPDNASLFYQLAINDKYATHPLPNRQNDSTLHQSAFTDFISCYTHGELNCMHIQSPDTINSEHIYLLPLSQPLTGLESTWRNLILPRTSYKTINQQVYALFSLKDIGCLSPYIQPAASNEELQICAAIYNQHLILANHKDDLITYLQQITQPEIPHYGFEREKTDLSKESNFTLLADMDRLLKGANKYEYLIPSFIRKHDEFFLGFSLSLQLIRDSRKMAKSS